MSGVSVALLSLFLCFVSVFLRVFACVWVGDDRSCPVGSSLRAASAVLQGLMEKKPLCVIYSLKNDCYEFGLHAASLTSKTFLQLALT